MSTVIFIACIFVIPMLLIGAFCILLRLFEILCDWYEWTTGESIDETLRPWEKPD